MAHEKIVQVSTDTARHVTPDNPLIINAPSGNYGDVVIEGGFIQVVVPANLVQFNNLTKKS